MRNRNGLNVRRTRYGVSLIEMLVVMSVASVMMGLGVTTIHLLLGSEHEATRSVRYAASVARLARLFREDIHAARQVEFPPVEPGKPAVLIAMVDGERDIRYELDAHLARRLESDGGTTPHRDVFYFPPR